MDLAQLGPCSRTVTSAGLGVLRGGDDHRPFWVQTFSLAVIYIDSADVEF
jgi:hypothetical protein